MVKEKEMNLSWKKIFLTGVLTSFVFGAAGLEEALANFNGNSTGYAWSEKAGWISFNTTTLYGVEMSDVTLDGYAWGEKAGYISFYRDTGSPVYGIGVNLIGSTAKLSGYAWGTQAGYIRFAAPNSTYENTSASNYGVTVNGSTGVFSGYAWSEKLGWIKFSGNCSSGSSGICNGGVYGVTTTWRGSGASPVASGSLISSIFDTGSTSVVYNFLMWQGVQPTGTSVKFQLATSANAGGPWSYIGPDGTGSSYYLPSAPGTQVKIKTENHMFQRYFRYKIYLFSDAGQTATPTVTDVIVNYTR